VALGYTERNPMTDVLSASARLTPYVVPRVTPGLVIVTSLDGPLYASFTGRDPALSSAIDMLDTRGIPVVFASSRPASDVMAAQALLGLGRQPFIANVGSTLYIPSGYFGDVPARHDGDWDVIDGVPRAAARLLASFYRHANSDIVIVGVGSRPSDRELLEVVDVPVIVRGDTDEHVDLLARLPAAYLTQRRGAAGWVEAILGTEDA
jgi:predicted mannosyl-3-phosphoglycerate phosphatase (HAD superfamily)